jgi:hypothetical protein
MSKSPDSAVDHGSGSGLVLALTNLTVGRRECQRRDGMTLTLKFADHELRDAEEEVLCCCCVVENIILKADANSFESFVDELKAYPKPVRNV